jgi:hypothetical protein
MTDANQRELPGAENWIGRSVVANKKSDRRRNQHDQNSNRGESRHRPVIIADAANVAFTNRDKPDVKGSVEQIHQMKKALEELGFRPIFIADASLRHHIDDQQRLERMQHAGDVLQAPAGTEADYFILSYAHQEGVAIVSNDTFNDRSEDFPEAWDRRVPFMIVEGEVILERDKLERATGHPASASSG